jgi:diguanylate cyclase (GGDEF)-like protein
MVMAWHGKGKAVTSLDRARLGICIFAVANTAMMLMVQRTDLSVGRWVLGAVSLALTALLCVVTYVRGQTFRWEPVLCGPLIVLVAAQASTGLIVVCYPLGVLMLQSLYDSAWQFRLRLIMMEAGLALLLLTPPSWLGLGSWSDSGLAKEVLAMVILALFASFMRVVSTMLTALVGASARGALLARTGIRTASATDMLGIRAVAEEAAAELCALHQGLVLISVHSRGNVDEVDAVFGMRDVSLGTVVPSTAFAGIDSADVGQVKVLTAGTEVLDGLLGGRRRTWWVCGLGSKNAQGYLLISVSERRPPEGVVDAVRTLITQVSVAEANCLAHEELSRLANQDQLTTIPNRRAFERLLTDAIGASVGSEESLALFVIDLDDFKQVNDGFGHGAGDQLLMEIANRLQDIAGDQGVAFRFGGDEFAVLLERLTAPAEAVRIANLLRERLSEPVHLAIGAVVCVGASVGVVTGTPGASMSDLMRAADIAMYSAKARGKNRVEVFSQEGHGGISKLRILEADLAQALHNGEIVVHYQPVIEIATGRWSAVEALARWQHPTWGTLTPDVFVPLAERLGQLDALMAHVLATACRDLTTWSSELTVSVNVSARQLADQGFAAEVRDILAVAGLAPTRLLLELTEVDALTLSLPCSQIEALNDLGVRIGLDRFGIGGTSLAHLRGLRLGQLKIDPLMFLEADFSGTDDVLHMIVAVGHVLSLDIVAAMLEDHEHVERAQRAGVTLVQGFYFTQPLTATEMATTSRTGS